MKGWMSASTTRCPPALPQFFGEFLTVPPEDGNPLQVEIPGEVVHGGPLYFVREIIPLRRRLHREMRAFQRILHVDDEAPEEHAKIWIGNAVADEKHGGTS